MGQYLEPDMFAIEKLKPLLEALDLRLEYSRQEYRKEDSLCICLYEKDRLIGECFIDDNDIEFGHCHIKRIDILKKWDRKKGFGSILMYATLAHLSALGASECTLTGFPRNFSFYVKNGFHDYLSNESSWYSLSIQEKKEILYANYPGDEKKETYFISHEDQIELVFRFNHIEAVRTANRNIDDLLSLYQSELYVLQQTKPILNLYADLTERSQVKNYLQTRFNFFNGFPHANGKVLFVDSLQKLLTAESSTAMDEENSPTVEMEDAFLDLQIGINY